MPFPQFHNSFTYKFKFVAQFSYSNYTTTLWPILPQLWNIWEKSEQFSARTFSLNRKSILLWRSTVFGWTAPTARSLRSVWLSPPARWTTRRCWSGCEHTVSDPVLTQNPKNVGRAGRKQRKIRRADGGKQHKSEPKRLRFCFETTYGPEGRGFESLTAYQKSSKSSDFEDFCFS